jgi:hypothetical protein
MNKFGNELKKADINLKKGRIKKNPDVPFKLVGDDLKKIYKPRFLVNNNLSLIQTDKPVLRFKGKYILGGNVGN